jgi:hypothetical protein
MKKTALFLMVFMIVVTTTMVVVSLFNPLLNPAMSWFLTVMYFVATLGSIFVYQGEK